VDWNMIFGCLAMTALKDMGNTEKSFSELVSVPFELVFNCLNNCKCSNMESLVEILNQLRKPDLAQLARMKTDNPCLLVEVPNIWESIFSSQEIAQKLKLDKSEICLPTLVDFYTRIVKSIRHYSLSWCSVGCILKGVSELYGRALYEDVFHKVSEREVIMALVWFQNTTSSLWSTNANVTKCFVEQMLNLCFNNGEVKLEWLRYLAFRIPVPLMLVGEKNGWPLLVSNIERLIAEKFKSKLSLQEVYQLSLDYNRPCDWYRLLAIFPEVEGKLPVDYENQTDVCLSSDCCLLRVWINVFGHKETKKEADKNLYGDSKLCFWEHAAIDMENGELLHIAVEAESLLGVQKTAWPGILNWRKINKTAVEISQDKWGDGHEITKFLLRRSKSIFPSRMGKNDPDSIIQETNLSLFKKRKGEQKQENKILNIIARIGSILLVLISLLLYYQLKF